MPSSTALVLPGELPPTRLCTRADTQSGFECESTSLNNFFRDWAHRNERSHANKTWVLPRPDDRPELPSVLGYYTLSATVIPRAEYLRVLEILPKQASDAGYGDSPLYLIGRLARHSALRGSTSSGRTLGAILLLDAFERILMCHAQMGGVAVVVDAETADAAGFYSKYGFVSQEEANARWPRKMLLRIETVLKAFHAVR
ncbi:hypothetical protein ACIHQR_03830 [Corallococcus coralloides]|uniref:hypothetical protein n=1 Tax=Corallococcus coralloides TaxID=184914 RepID=UPI00384D92B6